MDWNIFVTDTVAAKSQVFVNSGLLGWLRVLLIMCHFYSSHGIPSFSSTVLLFWFGWSWCGGRIFASAYPFKKSCHWKAGLFGEAIPFAMPGCLFILAASLQVWYGIIALLPCMWLLHALLHGCLLLFQGGWSVGCSYFKGGVWPVGSYFKGWPVGEAALPYRGKLVIAWTPYSFEYSLF